ncbi:MAG: glycoside hydrolase family 3 C-terminal domain-containing protein [Cellulomonadaceae bacterium]|jgi:beta-glucosidase|nr:glycoside hydrolase family 3 C-terminal domain-containing protein [Cellulomonadaceae bacterium]
MTDVTVTENHSPVRAMPQPSTRVRELVAQMTVEEKLAQIVSFWLDQGGNVVAPMQGEMGAASAGQTLADITKHGLGQYTRVYGTRPVDPIKRAQWLWEEQRRLKRETRLGIPALVHEECLTGLAAWQAATFPVPLSWGASFNPELVYDCGQVIGQSMKQLGIHLGLAPVMDVIRDLRWGRVDECISEDPYVVGTIGTSYVRGLQDAGVHATLKHFLGYSKGRAGRNHAPVYAGNREVRDTFLPPFEMAILDGGVKSVMNSYTDLDGVPMAANEDWLTGVLREEIGFEGTVVADYFAIAFLQVMHGIAADRAEAAAEALTAGIDVELPGMDAYPLLAEKVKDGTFDERLIDRALYRHLAQKEELGLLDADAFEGEPPTTIDLDSPEHQRIARRMAEQSVVLLSNDGVLPVRTAPAKIAVIGENADKAAGLQGCYSFANHVLAGFPDYEMGFSIPTIVEALPAAFQAAGMAAPELVLAKGAGIESDSLADIPAAVTVTQDADLAIVVVGDNAGLFGRGTVGEGNDAESLELPGAQRQLVEALVATGTPVVMVVVTGRPYVLGWALDGDQAKPAAVLQSFFPGEGGGLAIADVITGAVNPSARLPISLPRSSGSQPYSYLHPILGGPSDVTNTDSTPTRPFGFGLSYTSFAYTDVTVPATVAAGDSFDVTVTVTNTGDVNGADVVQVYGRDIKGSITRPTSQLLGYRRVELAAGESKAVTFTVPTQRFSFHDRTMTRIVEPGDVQVWVASHCDVDDPAAVAANEKKSIEIEGKAAKVVIPGTSTARATLSITGDNYRVTYADPRLVSATIN